VEVNTFGPARPAPAPAVHAPALALLFSVALLAGAYLSSAALFLRNYHLTRRAALAQCPRAVVTSASIPRHSCVMHTAC
jgi:hypothetical protein